MSNEITYPANKNRNVPARTSTEIERNPDRNPSRPRRRRGRRRNPWRPDARAAAALGIVGAGIGLVSTIAAGAVRRTWSKLLLGAGAGAATGAVLGATMPKGRERNPKVRAVANPVGVATAVGAGVVLALVPVAIAAQRLPMAANRTMPPTVRGKMGPHAVDVFRQGATWGWRAPGVKVQGSAASAGGAGDTRRDAIINAYSDLVVANLQPTDRITLDFYPEQFQVQIDEIDAIWRWTTTTGEGGDADSRGAALLAALDWVDDHSQLA